jgi:hypothetical protein
VWTGVGPATVFVPGNGRNSGVVGFRLRAPSIDTPVDDRVAHERLARQAALGAGIPDWWDTLDGETLAELRADAALLAKRRDDFLAGRPTDVPPGPTPAEIEAARGELHAALRAEQEAEERQARRKQEFETRKRELETRKRELETKLARSGERIVRLEAAAA